MSDTQSLTTSSSSAAGSQTNTQSPQASVQPSDLAGAQTSAVQPGTATSLLNSVSGGIPLGGATVSTVNLSATAATSSQTNAQTASQKTHVNGALLGISIGLFVVAVVIFFVLSKSAKNTTH